MSINIEKVKSVLAGEKHEVSFEEHKYILQCFLKLAHDEGKTLEEQKKVLAQILDYTINLAGSEEVKETPEVLLSIAIVKTLLHEPRFRVDLIREKSWVKWSKIHKSIIHYAEDINQLLSSVTGPEGLLEFRDVELPA